MARTGSDRIRRRGDWVLRSELAQEPAARGVQRQLGAAGFQLAQRRFVAPITDGDAQAVDTAGGFEAEEGMDEEQLIVAEEGL